VSPLPAPPPPIASWALRSPYLDDAADVGHGLALGDQLLGGFELMDDLLPYVPVISYDRFSVWPGEDFHSPWIGFRRPRQADIDPVKSCIHPPWVERWSPRLVTWNHGCDIPVA